MGADDSDERPDEDEMRSRVVDKIGRKDLRAIIAVDRVVDPLRRIVTFLNGVSSVTVLLLEVLEYRAPDGTRLAAINVYGGPESQATSPLIKGLWDEKRFLEKLRVQARPQSVPVVEMLRQFIQEQADSPVWGSGLEEGSVGFGVRRGGARFVVFGVTTRGKAYVSSGGLNRHVPVAQREKLIESLRQIGVTVPETFITSDTWVAFDAASLSTDDQSGAFKGAVLSIRDAINSSPS